jgi:predicted RNA-binding protein
MCESNAFLVRAGKEELLMESVDYMKMDGDRVILKSIFGETADVRARLTELHLSAHRIVLEAE